MNKRGKAYVLCGLVGLAVAVSPLAYLWISAKWTVAKVLRNPTVRLSEKETERVWKYISGDFLFRAPWCEISDGEQAKLVQAALERTAEYSGDFLLIAIAEAWHNQGAFLTLPYAVNAAILRGEKNAGDMLASLAEYDSRFRCYIVFDFIMRKSKDTDLIVLSCLGPDMYILDSHRDAYIAMLKRNDVKPIAKLALLEKLASENAGARWFAGREQILENLRELEDEDINESIAKILRQIRGETQAAENAEPKP